MKPMSDPLRRINRAKKHLNTLNREIKAFLASNPYRCTIKKDPQDGANVFCPYLIKRFPFTWGLLIGEVAHGLRTALDNIAWSLAVTRDNLTCFPIYLERNSKFTTRLQRLRNDIWDDVKAVQPYNRPDEIRRMHPLWLLAVIDDIDKHRIILPTVNKIYISTGLKHPKFFFIDGITRLNKGDVEFKLQTPLNLNKNFKPELTGQIIFDISSAAKDPADPPRIFLKDLFYIHHFVRYDVYPRFGKLLELKDGVQ